MRTGPRVEATELRERERSEQRQHAANAPREHGEVSRARSLGHLGRSEEDADADDCPDDDAGGAQGSEDPPQAAVVAGRHHLTNRTPVRFSGYPVNPTVSIDVPAVPGGSSKEAASPVRASS